MIIYFTAFNQYIIQTYLQDGKAQILLGFGFGILERIAYADFFADDSTQHLPQVIVVPSSNYNLPAPNAANSAVHKLRASISGDGNYYSRMVRSKRRYSWSESHCDRWSVSMFWCHDQMFVTCLTIAVLSCSGVLSDEMSGLSFVSHSI
jgi:hypothetical protein